jgi:hypothetical protein
MFEFADQDAARQTAEQVLALLRDAPEPQPNVRPSAAVACCSDVCPGARNDRHGNPGAARRVLAGASRSAARPCRRASGVGCHLLRGQPPQTAAHHLPLLYSLCGQAHRLTAELAVHTALHGETPIDPEAQRMLEAETRREHVRRMLLEWPRLLGNPSMRPDLSQLLPGSTPATGDAGLAGRVGGAMA